MAHADNLAGHRARYEFMKRTQPPERVGLAYIGLNCADEATASLIGRIEQEAIERHQALNGAYIIDLGCGIGRLSKQLLKAPIRAYLGLDILPEILAEAEGVAKSSTFRFALANDFSIPEQDEQADIVCGFSLITHLLDEEAFSYFKESHRVLKAGGLAVFSFLDFSNPRHMRQFFHSVRSVKVKRDLLKFFEKQTLKRFGEAAGFEILEIVDGIVDQSAPGEPLINRSGQALLYMRKP